LNKIIDPCYRINIQNVCLAFKLVDRAVITSCRRHENRLRIYLFS